MNTLDFVFETKGLTDAGQFEGYASTFGNVDSGGDVVDPGAFIESIVRAKAESRVIPLLWQHDAREPIGVLPDIAEDSRGLYVKGQLLIESDPLARRAHSLIKAKAIGGMSIGYRVPVGGAEEDAKRHGVRRLKKLDLVEVSLVTFPMNVQARVTAVKEEVLSLRDRFAAGERLTTRELERLLKCQLDLSNAEAERAVRRMFKEDQGEPDATAQQTAFLKSLLTCCGDENKQTI